MGWTIAAPPHGAGQPLSASAEPHTLTDVSLHMSSKQEAGRRPFETDATHRVVSTSLRMNEKAHPLLEAFLAPEGFIQ